MSECSGEHNTARFHWQKVPPKKTRTLAKLQRPLKATRTHCTKRKNGIARKETRYGEVVTRLVQELRNEF